MEEAIDLDCRDRLDGVGKTIMKHDTTDEETEVKFVERWANEHRHELIV